MSAGDPPNATSAPAGVPHATPAPSHAIPPIGRIFLASRSPRRRELLAQYGIEHDCGHPGFDDAILRPGNTPPRTWVTSLAHLKALAGLELLHQQGRADHYAYVLGADTTCVRNGAVIGSPADARQARSILLALRDGDHEVFTGVALVSTADASRTLFADRASVHWGHVTDAQIEEYLQTGRWHAKAGAYNLHERIAAGWPITYAGDASTITGLPMDMLVRVLNRLHARQLTRHRRSTAT